MKDMQYENVNMSWDYRMFPFRPVAAEQYETRGRNNIISNYHYRVYKNLGKGVCTIHWIVCGCKACVTQLDKDWFTKLCSILNQGMPM